LPDPKWLCFQAGLFCIVSAANPIEDLQSVCYDYRHAGGESVAERTIEGPVGWLTVQLS
jgi:hypothetical protein